MISHMSLAYLANTSARRPDATEQRRGRHDAKGALSPRRLAFDEPHGGGEDAVVVRGRTPSIRSTIIETTASAIAS